MHFAIRFGGFKESDTTIVGVAHQPGEVVLPKVALDLAAHRTCSERQPRHLHAGLAERDPVSGSAARCGQQWKSCGRRERAGGSESSL